MTTLKLAFISGKVRNFVAFSLSVLVALLLTSCKDKQDTYSYQLHKLNLTAKKTNMPAYISKIVRSPNSSLFIIGDFVNLFLFDYNVNLLKRIKVLYGGTFTPTDTDFDPSTKTLYIANYRGNNVLVGILDLDSLQVKVVSELGDNNTISPEGVVAFDGHVAVANYDGNNVQIFSYTGTKLCEIPVFHAHGIAHTDGYLFATSLGDRQVLKIDTDECAIVSRTGSQGWARGQFMWPTGLGAGNGKLVVSDAHTGMLSSLSADTFEIYEHWGGNGPGAFNMPYAAEFDNEDVWIISTFNRTIFQMRDRKVINAWAQEMEDNVKSSLQWKLDSAKYSADYVRNETVEIRGTCYRPGYARLLKCDDSSEFPDFPVRNTLGYNYFVHAIRGDSGTFVFSPQNPYLYYFEDNGLCAPPVIFSHDMWSTDGTIVGRRDRIDHLEHEKIIRNALSDCSKSTLRSVDG